MSEWIKWNGGDCPVPKRTLVDVEHRDGDFGTFLFAGTDEFLPQSRGNANAEDWSHTDEGGDIIAYRVVKL